MHAADRTFRPVLASAHPHEAVEDALLAQLATMPKGHSIPRSHDIQLVQRKELSKALLSSDAQPCCLAVVVPLAHLLLANSQIALYRLQALTIIQRKSPVASTTLLYQLVDLRIAVAWSTKRNLS